MPSGFYHVEKTANVAFWIQSQVSIADVSISGPEGPTAYNLREGQPGLNKRIYAGGEAGAWDQHGIFSVLALAVPFCYS